MKFLKFFTICMGLATFTNAQAASLAASCTMNAQGQIRGENENERLPIASVSKVMTAWWSQSVGGADYRFETKFHVTELSDGKFNIHIEGSRDPYFGKESLHFAISELNKLGIKKIRNLTFDENFKFYVEVTSSARAMGFYTTSSPRPSKVLFELESMGRLTNGWNKTFRLAESSDIPLIEEPNFRYENLSFLSNLEFQPNHDTKTLTMRSSPLPLLLKEMNRNSNNHAANQIFESFGGARKFRDFAAKKLHLSSDEIRFLNGSGDRVDLDSGATYNEASCAATLKVMQDYRATLRKSDMDLEDIMALSGGDPSSTVSKIYQNDMTRNALIAKTGTVNPAITLAGLIRTQDGEILFMYNFATKGNTADWRSARSKIRTKVTDLIRRHNGGRPLKYSAFTFTSVDAESIFQGDDLETDELDELVTEIPYGRPLPKPENIIQKSSLSQRPPAKPAHLQGLTEGTEP